MIVLLTDGRANVSLAKSNEEPDAIAEGAPKPTQELLKTEVLDMAKRCGSSGFNLLVIDTENKARPAVLLSRALGPSMRSHSEVGMSLLQRTWLVAMCKHRNFLFCGYKDTCISSVFSPVQSLHRERDTHISVVTVKDTASKAMLSGVSDSDSV